MNDLSTIRLISTLGFDIGKMNSSLVSGTSGDHYSSYVFAHEVPGRFS